MGQALSKAADTLVAAAEGPAPERRPAARNSRLAVFGVALVLALLGLAALAREVHLAILAAPVVPALLWLIKPARPWIARLATPLFALLALVGFNVAWHGVG